MSDDLTQRGDEVYERLFGAPPPQDDPDPELMGILRRVVFGDVFSVGDLDDRARELLTIGVLATLQCLPQLASHTGAALRVGATPVEVREAVYQLAPYIGFPRTLNAVTAINEGFTAAGVELPLEPQGTVAVQDRYAAGAAIQDRLYGDEIKAEFADGSAVGDALPRLLTEFGFGDIETRAGLSVAERELVVLCCLVALGLAPQVAAHVRGCERAGLDRATIAAAILHTGPYAGMPNAINALRALNALGSGPDAP
jgi:4-carboxymuconolactone decarboxylase